MSYIGNQPTQIAFLTDSFSGNASTTVFTMSVAPANTASVLVAIFGVLQDPSTYSVVGTSLTFSAAPPSGTGNISVRYLGIPASGVTTTAYRTVTEFTATSGQVTFTPPSYTVGFIAVYRNGVMLGSADYTASNGTTVTLTTGATSGDLVTTESFYVSSVLNAIPNIAGSVVESNIGTGAVTAIKLATTGTASSSTYLRGDMAWAGMPCYTATYLVVGGGGQGGGGSNQSEGGGGGAGGVVTGSMPLIQGAVYSAVVGAGGTGNTGSTVPGINGGTSWFAQVSAIGGGGGGSRNTDAYRGQFGGSGGGGGQRDDVYPNFGFGIPGQGNYGGSGANSPSANGGGGGGGAGGVGQDSPGTTTGGNGGVGIVSTITGSSVYYGGGGGGSGTSTGGTGGTGGGASGVTGATGNNATPNTGGGGGGAGTTGGNGGSGVVIISIPTANYSGVTTGSPTITTNGAFTVIKFTSNGSYTA
jgi:hypothetical protein